MVLSGSTALHRIRKWRIDFAWLDIKLAVEVDGGIFHKLGHQTLGGVLHDAEKAEALLLHGWTLYRVPGPWIVMNHKRVWRPEVAATIQQLRDQLEESQ